MKGLWFWLEYFFYPFLDWIFYPFFRFTIWPLLSWIYSGLTYLFSFNTPLAEEAPVHVDDLIENVIENTMLGMNEMLGENARTVIDTAVE